MGIDYDSSYALAAKAIEGGASLQSPIRIEWDVSGGCTSPVTFEHFARPQQWTSEAISGPVTKMLRDAFSTRLLDRAPVRGYISSAKSNTPIWIILEVRCRKCPWCLRARAREWTQKARNEIGEASRTWFATFTLSPDEHFRCLSIARMLSAEASAIFEERSPEDQFRLRVRALSADITRYIKRIRKESGSKLRYIIVAERHESGLPHFHALFHEVLSDKPIRKAVLKEQWPHGFSTFKLVESDAAAWYVCKYLSKDIACRVRASLRYGQVTTLPLQGGRDSARVMRPTQRAKALACLTKEKSDGLSSSL